MDPPDQLSLIVGKAFPRAVSQKYLAIFLSTVVT